MEESEVLENAEVRQEETRFLPMITQEIRKYYFIEVEDPKIKGGALFHKELQKMLEMSQPQLTLDLVTSQRSPPSNDVSNEEGPSFDSMLQPNPPSDDVTSQPQPSLEDVAQQPHPPFDDVAQQTHHPLDDVAQQPLLPLAALIGEKKPQKTLILLADYIRFTKDDKKRSRWTFYRDLHSGKLGFPAKVLFKGKKKYYFIEIEDPKIIERASFHDAIQKMLKMKEKTIYIHIKVPEKISKAVNMISSPDSLDYRRFYEFIDQRPTKVLPIRIDFNPVTYIGRRINIREEDYQKVLRIAEANDLSVSKVIVTLLKSYLALEYKIHLEEN